MRRLWIPMLAVVVVVAGLEVRDGDQALAAVYLVGGLLLVWWLAPFRGGRTTTHQEAQDMSESERPVVIYWRPGCGYCARLRTSLGAEGDKALWVNIWQDEEAAAFVRSVNDGNEVVPTVVIDGTPHTNPDPALVKDRVLEV